MSSLELLLVVVIDTAAVGVVAEQAVVRVAGEVAV